MRVASRAAAVLLNSLLAACISAPHVAPVEKPVETRTDLGLGATAAPVQDDWWAAYQDPQLDQLLEAALADNPTLAQTLARLRQAQAVVFATRAALWPYVSYDASETRERVSSHDTIPSQFAGGEFWKGQEGLNFSWDLDFWGQAGGARAPGPERGGGHSARRAGRPTGDYQCGGACLPRPGALLSSSSMYGGAKRQQRQQILDITRHRFKAGLDTSVELRQAEGGCSRGARRTHWRGGCDRSRCPPARGAVGARSG